MAVSAPARFQLNPNFQDPRPVVDLFQRSGAMKVLPDGHPKSGINFTDKMVYVNRLTLKTQNSISQDSQNQLVGADIIMSQMQTAVYLLQVAVSYNRHEAGAVSNYGVSLPQAYSLGLNQSIYNQLRHLLLYGFQPEFGEGLLNAPGIKKTVLPPDDNNTKDIKNMISGHISTVILNEIQDIISRTQQSGMKNVITILAPQRVLNLFAFAKIVNLATFQLAGSGTATIKGQLDAVLKDNDTVLLWQYDDTLESKGDNSTDAVIITLRQLDLSGQDVYANTNIFADSITHNDACNAMYTDLPAPLEIISPLPGGATHLQKELSATSGWALRPEATTVLSVAVDVDTTTLFTPPANTNTTSSKKAA
ncbi:unnamed protein product [Commensalibacter communis]|uniref:major capsid family protein n=1 Tax=Commensalibacter communis TaxID=2972786 RepID=UPI0022FFA033|nr:major capsid family protein [Commensalibacter communis]CAI3954116.1 unnamed protein product [Commensalibacter communis]CAI3958737.1 unnamed protein product [Commensalibacter communis]